MSYKIRLPLEQKSLHFHYSQYNPIYIYIILAFHLPNTQIKIFHIPVVVAGYFLKIVTGKGPLTAKFLRYFIKQTRKMLYHPPCARSLLIFFPAAGSGKFLWGKRIFLCLLLLKTRALRDLINGLYLTERRAKGDIQELDSYNRIFDKDRKRFQI